MAPKAQTVILYVELEKGIQSMKSGEYGVSPTDFLLLFY